jgi:hypothetical protein
MSPSIKFGLIALVGAAAAVPHYGGHSKFHHKPSDAGSGYAGPTGGWGKNSTVAAAPTGTGYAPAPGGDESTTDTTTTSTIKSTITQTLYVTPVPAGEGPTSVGAVDVSTGAAACGPATITVTATNKVTVTVPAGGAAPSSSGGAPAPYVPEVPKESSASSVVEAPTQGGKSSEYPTGPKPTMGAPAPTKESSAYVAPAPSSSKESAAPVKPTSEAYAPMPTSDVASATQPAKTSEYASAAPSSKPSNTPSVPASGKRGLLYRYDGASVAKGFAEMSSFGFMHNWEGTPKGDIGNAVFYPTLRSLDRAGEWAADLEQSNSNVVFTFNEPDMGSQANMDTGAACTAWKEHVLPLMSKHSDKNFVAPSVSSSEKANEGLQWLSKFMTDCPEAVFSTVNIHWYGTPANGFEAFKKHIENVSSTTNKPFYVSEFAMNECSGEQGAAFLKEAMEYLDSNPNCVGYSPFAAGSFDPGYGMTLDNLLGAATALTPVGKAYMGSA